MGKIVVVNNLTLDGVMQSPSGPEEDRRDGFTHGGWAARYNDDVKLREMSKGMSADGSLLFGRVTYEHFYSYWPHQTDNPYTEVLNRKQKYVVSTTLVEPLPWMNSTLLRDAGSSVETIKEETEGDTVVLGSGRLVRSLLAGDLVDRLVLLLHPLVLGSGKRMFDESGRCADFRLIDSVPTGTGVIIATYERS